MAQLIRDGDHYWDYGHREQFGYDEIEKRFGVIPERFADYLALTGDSVDNIRGVPGIGPKTAAALMKEFASLEDLYAGLERVDAPEAARRARPARAAAPHREAAFLARRLTMIACDMPLGG